MLRKLKSLIPLSIIALAAHRSLGFLSHSSISFRVPHFSVFTPSFQIIACSMSSQDKSEVEAAKVAESTDPAINPYAPTFFDKIVSKQIPANIIYEDGSIHIHPMNYLTFSLDLALAFRDINPQVYLHLPS